MPKQIYLFSISSHPKAISINSLHVEYLRPDIDFSKYDYLIFTSKQAVEALKQYDKEEYIHKLALSISAQTSISYESIGGKILLTGSGYGDNLSTKIKEFPKGTKWLYLRAEEVASDFSKTCKNDGYNIDEKIVYRSRCSQEILDVKVDKDSILIFTSPSSLRCFMKTHILDKSYEVIVIGETTAKVLPNGIEYRVSQNTSIESCMELAHTL